MKKIRMTEGELIDLIEKLVKENLSNGNAQNLGMMDTPTAKYKDLMEKEDDWSSMFTVFGGIVDVKNKENLLNKEEIKALD